MSYLLDTCVLSEYVKSKPSDKVINWIDAQEELNLFISILTVAELKKGIIRIQDSNPTRHEKLWNWLQEIEQRFSARILPLDENVLDTWAKMCGESEAKGKKLPVMDSLLAATARVYDMILVTRNTVDFQFASIKLFNPWDLS